MESARVALPRDLVVEKLLESYRKTLTALVQRHGHLIPPGGPGSVRAGAAGCGRNDAGTILARGRDEARLSRDETENNVAGWPGPPCAQGGDAQAEASKRPGRTACRGELGEGGGVC